LILPVEERKAFSAAASTITLHINAMDKATAEAVKEKLRTKAKDLVEMVEIREDGIRRLGKHLTNEIKSLGTSDVTVEIGKNINQMLQIIF